MAETIEQFLFREAVLMDEHRYDEWLDLWTDDAIYWVPCRHEDFDPHRQVSIIYDRRSRLEARVARLKSGDVLAQDPQPRMRRVLSNIAIELDSGDNMQTASNFVLVQARNSRQEIWCGRSIHHLQRIAGQIKIAQKRVLLVNSECEMPALQFLV
jgi:benzoate/toluate 1,2-dioxygenase beta subunit